MRTIRPSLALVACAAVAVPFFGAKLDARRDVVRMVDAANGLLAVLDADQRARATFDFEAEERTRFHFIPIESFERRGLMLEEMSPEQVERAHELLRAGLSQRGYMTARQVMELEDVLLALEGGQRFARDRDQYFFGFFGTPSRDGTWGWRFEGHHLSLHFTIVGGTAAVGSPAFVGANPAEVREGPQRGRRVLGDREDAARALVRALSGEQRAVAIIDVEAPRDILTGNAPEVDPLAPVGIEAAAMSAEQRAMLMEVIDVYLGMMADDIAGQRRQRLMASDTDRIAFAWAGSTEPGEPHYYRVQGPSMLIEYDNTQNGANHIHSVWRDFDGDFGRDLIREHRGQHPHE